MYTPKFFAALLLSSAMVVGCEEGRDTGTNPRTTGDSDEVYTPRSSSQNGAQGSQVQVRAKSLIEQINTSIRNKEFDQAEQSLKELESMRAQLPQQMQTQIATLRGSLNSAKQAGGQPSPATQQPGQQPGQSGVQNPEASQQAQKLISQINEHIRNQEFDEAEDKISQLEQMRTQLPQSMQTQIQTLRTSLDRAKAGSATGAGGTTPPEE